MSPTANTTIHVTTIYSPDSSPYSTQRGILTPKRVAMTSVTDDDRAYLAVVKQAVQSGDYFASFKRLPAYTKVLEHVS